MHAEVETGTGLDVRTRVENQLDDLDAAREYTYDMDWIIAVEYLVKALQWRLDAVKEVSVGS